MVVSQKEAPNLLYSESGMKWMGSSPKRQCERTLGEFVHFVSSYEDKWPEIFLPQPAKL